MIWLLALTLTIPSITVHHATDPAAVRSLVAAACQLLAPAVPTDSIVVDAPGHQFDLVPPDQRAALRAKFRETYGAAERDYPVGALIGVRDPVIFLSLAADGIAQRDAAKVAAWLVYASAIAKRQSHPVAWRAAATTYRHLLETGRATDHHFLDQLEARAGQ